VIPVLQSISIGILFFFLLYCIATLTLLVMSVREMAWYARGREPTRTRPDDLGHRPSVSVVAPAFNEETLIVQSANAFLASAYAPLEVVIADDGSRDATFARLDEAFDLVPLPLRGRTALPTAPIHGVHISRVDPRLRVVRKENGGRSDAINAGISVARGELVVICDADSLLESDAIMRSVRPFEVNPDHCMAVGGGIRVANGSQIVAGRVVAPGVGWRGVGATQVLEYLRGFLATRIAWSEMNGLLIVSGAFGVFRRDLLVALGGFSRATLGEDMEMTMRIHHLLRPQWKGARTWSSHLTRCAGPRRPAPWPDCATSACAGTPGCSTTSACTGGCSGDRASAPPGRSRCPTRCCSRRSSRSSRFWALRS
jgi:cellulose synthase/poly-beta-1,6-N-acetylglucosamine synthase-like glycosyltransferase